MLNLNELIEQMDNDTKDSISLFFEKEIPTYVENIKLLKQKIEKTAEYQISLQIKFNELTDNILNCGEAAISKDSNKLVAKKVKELFRETVKDLIFCGEVSKRSFERPRGYPGDFVTIEMFYENKGSPNGFGAYCDRYLLNQDYVQAVRDRKDYMKKKLNDFLSSAQNKEIKILNIASGSCREIRELPKSVVDLKQIECNLLDQDKDSLNFASQEIEKIHPSAKVNQIVVNVLDFARYPKKYQNKFGEMDLIYCIGLADYIPDDWLSGMTTTAISILKPNGSLYIAHKNVIRHKSVSSDWLCNWTFLPRDEKHFTNIVLSGANSKDCVFNLVQIQNGHIFFGEFLKKR